MTYRDDAPLAGLGDGRGCGARAVSERKRMSRAKVAANPQREVFRGATASLWVIDDALPTEPRPPAQGGALFRREDIDAAIERGSALSPSDRQALLMGTFPDRSRSDAPTSDVVREMFRAEYLGEWPRERDQRGLPRDAIAFRGRVYDRTATLDVLDRERTARARAQRDESGGTFSNGPRGVLTIDALNAAMEALRGPRVTLPQTIAMPPSLYEELRRFGDGRSDDQTDAVAWATGIDWSAAEVRERARLRAAQYEREAPWRARILASIPAPRHITAAELRARVTPHGYGWRR